MKQLREHQDFAEKSLSRAIKGIVNMPTGTGKTLVQSRAIVNQIAANISQPKVYVILSPRILLSNQLLGEVKDDLVENGVDAQYCIVHSGRYNDGGDEFINYREILSGTSTSTVQEAYRRSVTEGVSLVISGTYHSADRIANSGVPVEIVFCDEAHYLVTEQFNWIVAEPFYARIYHFTATTRETPSKNGMGMNNTELFGEILYQVTPLEMILKGEMVRPRMHIVDMDIDPTRDEGDGLAVVEAFNEHRSLVRNGAKMLVVSKDGSDHLNSLATHPELVAMLETHPNFNIFDISSEHGPRINGQRVRRESFLTSLQNLTDSDEAVIIHHDILAEGIDVPGITGVMPLISLGKAKFLQTLGRATRLHGKDRSRLYEGSMVADELKRFVKPHAWLIVPVYGVIGDDMYDDMKEMIRELRDYGFNPSEDVVVRQKRGKNVPVPLSTVNEMTDVMRSVFDFSADVMHELEEKDKASEFNLDVAKFAEKSIDEQLSELSLEW